MSSTAVEKIDFEGLNADDIGLLRAFNTGVERAKEATTVPRELLLGIIGVGEVLRPSFWRGSHEAPDDT